ncbi:MAG: peptidase M22 [Ruminococcaceae bacterium]|nr:peptidase M22 [Oscillospiraceae bacterium]
MCDPTARCFVGFDTSNYTTSAAVTVLDSTGRPQVVANIKIPLPVSEGARGLRQSDAVFAHVKNLPGAISQLRRVISDQGLTVAAVGYSATPRDTEGSYMPCFLSGRVAAEAFAAGAGVPIYAFSHQSGHIMAALYSSGALFEEGFMMKPFLAFHVSGGTTEAVIATPRDGGFDVDLVGYGADLHAGQVIDRAGVMMGLSFPCGKEMEALASEYVQKASIKGLKVCVQDGICHLSGLENQAADLWRKTSDAGHVSAYVLSFIGKTLRRMTDQIQEKMETPLPVVYGGGVMSNKLIRPTLTDKANWKCYFAEPAFSADNAAGISVLCARENERKGAS